MYLLGNYAVMNSKVSTGFYEPPRNEEECNKGLVTIECSLAY